MLDKKSTKKAGYGVIDSSETIVDDKVTKLKQIRQILPGLVNGDDKLDVDALKDFLGQDNLISSKQGYLLNFAGKGLANAQADISTNKELRIERKLSSNFDKTKNTIIRGDNLDVLKILRQNYTNKIQMIYIDPPYNTENANFIYKDSFKVNEKQLIEDYDIDPEAQDFFENMFGSLNHSGWMFAMYPRLKLARELLTDNGVILISIDDKEMANLKLMCSEIFGEPNFITTFTWVTKTAPKGVPPKTGVVANHEYILCYAKNNNTYFVGKDRGLTGFSNPDNDPQGPWKADNMKSTVPTRSEFTITDPDTGNKFHKKWALSRSRIEKMIKEKRIIFPKDKSGTPRQKKYPHEYQNPYLPITSHLGPYQTETATNKLKKLFDNIKVMDFPKPVDLIKKFIKATPDKDFFILDFFAGSGTTAHAVMKQNKEDGGNRKFILVQSDEKIDPQKNKEAHDFCISNKLDPFISSICIERVRRAGHKILKEAGMLAEDLDTDYKVFSLIDRPQLQEADTGSLKLQINRFTPADTLYNMMAASGEVLLTESIKEIEEDLLYKVGNSYFVLGQCKSSLKEFANHRIYIDGYADINLEKWLNLLGLNRETVKVIY